ncbi:hypothetical protein [Ktedonobacter sp. SOSP1-52]|nr:hypothetical protein [Ktedonobacter sp. SOSP1-52]
MEEGSRHLRQFSRRANRKIDELALLRLGEVPGAFHTSVGSGEA